MAEIRSWRQHRFGALLAAGGLGLSLTMLGMTPVPVSDQQPREPWVAPRRAARKKNPIPADTQSVRTGKAVYLRECSSCHGKDGRGRGSKAAELDVPPGDLTSPKVQEQAEGTLYWKITKGRAPMASFKTLLTDDQRWHVINYVRTFAGDAKQVTPPRFQAPQTHRQALSALVEPYLKIHRALIEEDATSAKMGAEALKEALGRLEDLKTDMLAREARSHWSDDLVAISRQSEGLSSSQDIKVLRQSFAGVSAAMATTIGHFGHAHKRPLRVFASNTKLNGEAATWIQLEGSPANPYDGSAADREQPTVIRTLGSRHSPKS